MGMFKNLKNNYEKFVNNLKKSDQKNKSDDYIHNISEQEFIETCVDYANVFGEEIVNDLNSSIDVDNQAFEKYENWILNGD